jgi:hypothetical protein
MIAAHATTRDANQKQTLAAAAQLLHVIVSFRASPTGSSDRPQPWLPLPASETKRNEYDTYRVRQREPFLKCTQDHESSKGASLGVLLSRRCSSLETIDSTISPFPRIIRIRPVSASKT